MAALRNRWHFNAVLTFQIMAKSRDWDELTWVWTEWRRKAGKPMRDLFEQLADLTNDAAKYNSECDFYRAAPSNCQNLNFKYK
jgi:hypothetical protein